MDAPHTTTTTTTTTTTATRPHYNYSPHPYNGREDCWSESATAVLIKAWGDRYLHLNRGNLRQKDWKDVADAVNSSVSVKTPKTDVQCKNRIDTIKKKYKQEKSKLPLPSKWPFYSHLDSLIGATTTPPVKHKSSSSFLSLHKLPSVTFTVKPYRQKLNPKPNSGGGSSSKSRINNSSNGSTGSSRSHGGEEGGDDGDANDDDDEEDDDDDTVFDEDHARKHRMVQDSSDGTAFRELARAILKFGEVYERIESSKQQQMMELEKQRMEFTKDLEFQRMQMFMEAQLELEKIKRPKYSSGTGKKL